MSLGITLKTATSGLNAAQTALRVVSDNIANVNTPGYVRKAVNQQPLVVEGMGQGVRIESIKRITDQYLHTASLTAASDASRWNAVSSYLDNAQSLFGDPAGTGFFFNRLDRIFAAFATAADDPSSTLLRSQGLANVEDFLTEARRINDQIDLRRFEARDADIELDLGVGENLKFFRENLHIPGRIPGDLVIGDHQSPFLDSGQMRNHDDRDRLKSQLICRQETSMAGDEASVFVYQHGVGRNSGG